MKNFLRNFLGLELLDKNFEELAQDDTEIMDRVRKVEKDMGDILIYLDVKREESWIDDHRFSPSQPRLVSSKWVKK